MDTSTINTLIEPLSDQKLLELKNLFYSFPSYKPDENGGTVSTTELTVWCERVGLPAEENRIHSYKRYWEETFGGVIPFKEYMGINRNVHDTPVNISDLAKGFDKDGDGIITVDEFEIMKDLICNHDQRFKLLDFDWFVHEADLNKDGLVSVEELRHWMAKYLKDMKL